MQYLAHKKQSLFAENVIDGTLDSTEAKVLKKSETHKHGSKADHASCILRRTRVSSSLIARRR
jgi:hypothetical protein